MRFVFPSRLHGGIYYLHFSRELEGGSLPLPSMSKQQSQELNSGLQSTYLQPLNIRPPSEVLAFLPWHCHLPSFIPEFPMPDVKPLSSGSHRPGEGGDAVWPLFWGWGVGCLCPSDRNWSQAPLLLLNMLLRPALSVGSTH